MAKPKKLTKPKTKRAIAMRKNVRKSVKEQPKALMLSDWIKALDQTIKTTLDNIADEDHAVIGEALLTWGAEIVGVIEGRSDDEIDNAKLVFPDSSLDRILMRMRIFQQEVGISTDALADFLIAKMNGDHELTIAHFN